MPVNTSVKKRLDSLLKEQRWNDLPYYHIYMNFPGETSEKDGHRIISDAADESGLVLTFHQLRQDRSVAKKGIIYKAADMFDRLFFPFPWSVAVSLSISRTQEQSLYFEIDKHIESRARSSLIHFFSSVYEKTFDSKEQLDYFLSSPPYLLKPESSKPGEDCGTFYYKEKK